jgi:BarA-like signal transduction histidine kinase
MQRDKESAAEIMRQKQAAGEFCVCPPLNSIRVLTKIIAEMRKAAEKDKK